MKNLIAGITAAALITLTPVTASANDDVAKIIAGIIVGVAIAETVNNPEPRTQDHRPHRDHYNRADRRRAEFDRNRICREELDYNGRYYERFFLNCRGEVVRTERVYN